MTSQQTSTSTPSGQPWLTMTPSQWGDTTGQQGGLFPVDSQGRLGGDLFADGSV